MRNVAIVFFRNIESESYGTYGDDYYHVSTLIASRITDWQEISEEEFLLLQKANRHKPEFMIIEKPDNQAQFIENTVSEVLQRIKKEQEQEEERKKEAEQKKLAAKLKKQAKDEAARKALYEKLKSEFE